MNSNDKILEQRLNEFQKRRNPDELLKKITQIPYKDWSPPEVEGPVLAYTLVSDVDPSFAASANRLWGNSSPLTFADGYHTRLEIKQGHAVKRLESLNKGIFGHSFCYILDPNQGTLFLDKTDKLFLHMDEEQTIKFQFSGVKAQIDKIEDAELNGQKVKMVTVKIMSTVAGKYILYFRKDAAFAAFANEVINTIISCAGDLNRIGVDCEELAKLGILVKGEFFITRDCVDRLASSFELESLRLEDYTEDIFSIPEGYSDLRDLKEKYADREEAFRHGEPVRYSTVRRNLRRDQTGASTLTEPTLDVGIGHASAAISIHTEDNLDFPECFPSTYGSQISNLVDQKLLDDIKYIVNGVSRRLDSFNGSGGNIDIDWLDQVEAHANSLTGGPGSGLFYLLRDTDLEGSGLLDRLAETRVRKLLVDGDVSSLTLPPVIIVEINLIMANPFIASEDRFDALSDTSQRDLREAYLEQKLAHINLDYPSSTPTSSVYYDLLNVKLLDINFEIDINNTSIIENLAFDTDFIRLLIKLPDAYGEAAMARWPTQKYYAILGASYLACFIFPPACALTVAVASVGLFLLLDFAAVGIELTDLEIDSQISLTPNAENILQPDVALKIDADISVLTLSVIPTGVHQIISLIISIVASHTDIVINQLESQLQDKLEDFLREDMGISYPPSFGPVPISGISNSLEFSAGDQMYIQTGLNAGLLGVVSPYITQVDSEVKDHLLQLREEFKIQFRDPVDRYNDPDVGGILPNWLDVDFDDVARYYLGSVLSQNFINHYIHTLWRDQVFTYEFTEPEASELLNLLVAAFPILEGFLETRVEAHLWPAVSPRTILTPSLAAKEGHYATTFFDDVRLCIGPAEGNEELSRIEFSFATQLFTELGFGGVNSKENTLDITKVRDRVFDLYFALDELGVKIIHPEIQFFSLPDMTISSSFDYSPLDSFDVQDALRLAMQFALATRNSNLIPRLFADSSAIQNYHIGVKAFQLYVQLVPFKQNIYINMGTSGVGTAVYDGALDIDAMDTLTAGLIRGAIP